MHIDFRLLGPALRARDATARLVLCASPPVAGRATALPRKVDVAIIGGGIVGIATALELARRRVSVALFEKGRLGGEQSTRNWGWCRQIGRDRRELPLAAKSMQLWREMALPRGSPRIFNPCGIVYLAATEHQAERYDSYLDDLGPRLAGARRLTDGHLADLLPGTQKTWLSAVHMAGDGRADPDLAMAELASAAEREGARLFSNCAVRELETSAGRVSAVVTELGRVACDSIVVAAGAWSSEFCRKHGLALPQIKVISSVLSTEPVESAPKVCVFGNGFTIGRQPDGGYVVGHGGAALLPLGPELFRFGSSFLPALRQEWNFVSSYVRVRMNALAIDDWRDRRPRLRKSTSPFERRRELSPAPSLDILRDALARLTDAFPGFRNVRVRKTWAGAMDITPDGLPVLSAVESIPGLILGTGFSGHGFGLGPGAGHVLADLATASEPAVDLTAFRFSRFSDGSRLLPGLRF